MAPRSDRALSEAILPHPVDCVWFGDASTHDGPLPVGACAWGGYQLSDHYRNQVATIRRPIFVIVPYSVDDNEPTRLDRGTWFCIDSHRTGDDDQPPPTGEAWTVTVDLDSLVLGAKPRITVAPSIHCVGIWHGWLQDGVLHQ